jgi:hypothetical protein
MPSKTLEQFDVLTHNYMKLKAKYTGVQPITICVRASSWICPESTTPPNETCFALLLQMQAEKL